LTDEEQRYWVGRCLRLEAEIAVLKGYHEAPLLPEIERRSLYETAPTVRAIARNVDPRPLPFDSQGLRRWNRRATANDIAEMRNLRRSGLSPAQIGKKVRLSDTTVRLHTKDVLLSREVGIEK